MSRGLEKQANLVRNWIQLWIRGWKKRSRRWRSMSQFDNSFLRKMPSRTGRCQVIDPESEVANELKLACVDGMPDLERVFIPLFEGQIVESLPGTR